MFVLNDSRLEKAHRDVDIGVLNLNFDSATRQVKIQIAYSVSPNSDLGNTP